MKMKKIMMVIMIILTLCLIASMGLNVQAVDNPLGVIDDDANAQYANEMYANQEYLNSQATQVIQPETGSTSNTKLNTTDKLPQTGVTEDITVMFFIIVCVISSIYAYKKIRDYKD